MSWPLIYEYITMNHLAVLKGRVKPYNPNWIDCFNKHSAPSKPAAPPPIQVVN